jgi:hypothetical protein
MEVKTIILLITAFFIYNTYKDGNVVKQMLTFKKHFTMLSWGIIGLGLYIYINNNPTKSHEMISHADTAMKYLPIDSESMSILTPLFTVSKMFTGGGSDNDSTYIPPTEKRMMNSGKHGGNKRSVSESKKKYVAANQGWKCFTCNTSLPASFEVDHTIRLDRGGSNNIDNLVALCRTCHGEKTLLENL